MIKFLLNSHRKKVRFFLYVLVISCVFVALVNITFSIYLNNALRQARKVVEKTAPGFYFNVRFAYFNLLRGVTFYGIECRRNGELIVSGRRVDLGFDLLSLVDRKIRIKNIRLSQSKVDITKFSDMPLLLDKILWKMDMPVELFETTYFLATDIGLNDTVLADVSGYISAIKGSIFTSRGDLVLKKIRVPAFPDSDIFFGSPFYKSFDFVFESQLDSKDFVVSRLEISNPDLKFNGSGRIADIFSKPVVLFNIDFLNIIFDNFPMLNREHFRARGVLDARLKVLGPIQELKADLNIKIANTEVNFFETLLLSKINGSLTVSFDKIEGSGFSLFINGIPFTSDFIITQGVYPHLLVKLFSLDRVSASPAFTIELESDSLEKELAGKARAKMRYLSSGTVNTLDFTLNDFRLGYDDGLFLDVAALKTGLILEPLSRSGKDKILSNTVSFNDVHCVLRKSDEGFSLENVSGSCYGGMIEGQLDFIIQNEKFGFIGEAHVRKVNLGEFFQNHEAPSYALLGNLDADLRFDTASADILKGQIFVTEGVIDRNPILNAVSDFLGVHSLKKVSFSELSVFFSGGKGEYTSQVKLDSSLVKGNLDGKISSYDKMDGYLALSLSTQLLNESKQFKKILAYIRHDQPSVLFSFKISSYVNSPRVLWLKNEFKDKLSNLLPERNKRFLQKQVNSMVESMEEE